MPGGSFTIIPIPITGELYFDWFFSVVLMFGALAFSLGLLISILRRW